VRGDYSEHSAAVIVHTHVSAIHDRLGQVTGGALFRAE
jgi:hypothetical protein